MIKVEEEASAISCGPHHCRLCLPWAFSCQGRPPWELEEERRPQLRRRPRRTTPRSAAVVGCCFFVVLQASSRRRRAVERAQAGGRVSSELVQERRPSRRRRRHGHVACLCAFSFLGWIIPCASWCPAGGRGRSMQWGDNGSLICSHGDGELRTRREGWSRASLMTWAADNSRHLHTGFQRQRNGQYEVKFCASLITQFSSEWREPQLDFDRVTCR